MYDYNRPLDKKKKNIFNAFLSYLLNFSDYMKIFEKLASLAESEPKL